MNLSGRTKVCTSMGYPISQSLSPAVQTAAFHSVGLDWVYIAWGVKPEHLESTIRALRPWENYMGGNVTAPHKEAVIPLLDDLTPTAARLHAVNVIRRGDGKLVGDNTDGSGFVRSLLEDGIFPTGKRFTVLGAGGAATSVAFALQDAHAAEIRLVNRTPAKAEALASRLATAGSATVSVHALTDEARFLEDADIVVNATSVGLQPEAKPLFAYTHLRPPLVVVDLVFFPRETAFLKRARENGCQTRNGLGMLLHQAVLSFETWTGMPAPQSLMREQFQDALVRREQET